MFNDDYIAIVVFTLTLVITFILAILGRKKSITNNEDDLADRNLNRWLVGLSAGATANSGFIVSGAVGLGYVYGIQWLLLPIAWLIGDLVFWRYFPSKLNYYARKTNSMTLTDILTNNKNTKASNLLAVLISLILVFGLGAYATAQWLAGKKFLVNAFEFSEDISLIIFALVIIAYSSIGGFRGSVYVDAFQAILRLLGCILIFVFAASTVYTNFDQFILNYETVPTDFFNIIGQMSITGAVGFIVGWGAASLGFGLGQPQVSMRYMAAKSPDELNKAKWIYIGYVQFTWVSMTVFGVILRGISPELDDPEAGLAIFVSTAMPAVLVGIIIADIFGVIASTANSILIALSHTIKHDLGKRLNLGKVFSITILSCIFGILTLTIAYNASSSVASISIAAISFIAAGLAGPVMIKILDWRHSDSSLLIAMFIGISTSILWSWLGYSSFVNEAAIGIVTSLITNRVLSHSKFQRAISYE